MASDSNNAKDAHSLSYSFLKLVHSSFHQGNHRFRERAGRQCVCNSLMSLIWSSIKKVSYWKSQDLDNILINGDSVYRDCTTLSYLSFSDIPNIVNLYNIQITIELLHNSSGIVSSQFPLKIHGFLPTDIGNGCLFFIKESCFSMFFGKELVGVFLIVF